MPAAKQLTIMRNAYYARHGKIFKRADLQSYFEAQPWYRPSADYRDDALSPREQSNVEFIQSFQKRMKLTQ